MNGHELIKFFPDFTVCSGDRGLDNNISTITVMDAPDMYNWMKGNEFLITSGYPFKDCSEKFAYTILKLKDKNVTALGIKISRFIKKLPDIVIETSNSVDLPIINIPDHYAFSDIINPGLTTIINSQYEELIKSEKIHNEFIKMGIYNCEISNVLERLNKLINKDAVYFDIKEKKVYSIPECSFKDIIKNNTINYIYKDNIYIHSVIDDQGLHGYLIVNCNFCELNSLDLRTIEYAQTMIIFHIQKEFSNKQIIKNYKDNFMLDILLNNIKSDEEIINRARLHGWKLESNMFCLIIDIDNYKLNYKSKDYQLDTEKTRDLIYEDIIGMMRKINKESYYVAKTDSIVYIVNYKSRNLDSFEKSLFEICKFIKAKYNYSLTISIGNRYESIREIYKSYEECLICLENARVFVEENTNIIKYCDISVYWNLLKALKKNGYENDPIIAKLKYLKKIDKINNTDYYSTIKQIISCDWNLKEASKVMYIHYNTIKYRYSKIKELLDNDLDNRTSKLKIELGLYMFEMLSFK